MLGNLRDERKNIIFFSRLRSPRRGIPRQTWPTATAAAAMPPRIGASPEGTLTMGDDRRPAEPTPAAMNAERSRLLSIDFIAALPRSAPALATGRTSRSTRSGPAASTERQPPGRRALQPAGAGGTDRRHRGAQHQRSPGRDSTKIADDLSSHYVLGYYTNNTKWDGRHPEAHRAPESHAARRSAPGASIARPPKRTWPPSASATAAWPRRAGRTVGDPPRAQRACHGSARGAHAAYGTRHRQRRRGRGGNRRDGNRRGRCKQGAEVEVRLTSKDGGEPVALRARSSRDRAER